MQEKNKIDERTAQPIGIVLRSTEKFDSCVIRWWPIDNRFRFGVIDDSTRVEEAGILWITLI